MSTVTKHFVHFYSPGTFMPEESPRIEVDSWDVEAAVKTAAGITERHGAKPYAFVFSTRQRVDSALDSVEIGRSGRYFIGGKTYTLAEIEAEENPANKILISNMKCNDMKRVWRGGHPWRTVCEFRDGDQIVEPAK